MTDSPPQDPSPEPGEPLELPRRSRWQIGLRTFSLFIVAIAVWMTDIANRRENARIQAGIETMLPIARELVITDPTQIAAVKRQEYWYDENIWDLHLPEGQFRLCLATREIDPKSSVLPPVVRSHPLGPGKHTVTLELDSTDDLWRVSVSIDKNKPLEVEEPKEWNEGHGSSGGSAISESRAFAPDKPVVLFHRRFSRRTKNPSSGRQTSRTPSGPSEGIMIWIEPMPSPPQSIDSSRTPEK